MLSVLQGLAPHQVVASSRGSSSKAPPPPPPLPPVVAWDHLDLEWLQHLALGLVLERDSVVLAHLLRWVISRLWVEGTFFVAFFWMCLILILNNYLLWDKINFLDYLGAFKVVQLAQVSHLDHCKSQIEIITLK